MAVSWYRAHCQRSVFTENPHEKKQAIHHPQAVLGRFFINKK